MTRSKAWYPYSPSDIDADTGDLTLEEFGAYQRLLNFHFHHQSIPVDINRISNILRVGPTKAKRIIKVLVRFFEEIDGAYRLVDCSVFSQNIRPLWGEWRPLREEIFERDGRVCAYCGNERGPHEIDHVIPLSLGGSNDQTNLVVACQKCNRTKGSKMLDTELREKLRNG